MATAAETLTGSSNASSSNGGGTGGGSAANGGGNGLPGANQTPSGWWDSVKDPEVKTWAANKKFPDAETALKSYRGMEQLWGADKAGRTVLLPKDENDADGWKALASKLGVPEKVDDYKLPFPDGTDDGFAKTAASWMHEAGIPPRAGKLVAERWNSWVAEQVQAGEAADKAESAKQMSGLEKEWGGKFAENKELAQRGFAAFAKQFGLDDKAALERAESVLGAANLTKFFHGLGSLNSESSFAGVDGKGGFSTTLADAQREVAQINADRIAGKISDHAWRTEYGPRKEKLGAIIAQASQN